uniref:Uncharacterized protein n=1 Tax=Oryza barthii TaxID=65489 RepID=A0A0D3FV32_9ORYZ
MKSMRSRTQHVLSALIHGATGILLLSTSIGATWCWRMKIHVSRAFKATIGMRSYL